VRHSVEGLSLTDFYRLIGDVWHVGDYIVPGSRELRRCGLDEAVGVVVEVFKNGGRYKDNLVDVAGVYWFYHVPDGCVLAYQEVKH